MEFKVNTAKKTAHPTFFLKLLSRLFRVCGTSFFHEGHEENEENLQAFHVNN